MEPTSWEQIILGTGAAGVLAIVLWLIITGRLVAAPHLEAEINAREREETQHERTREELRKNIKEIERMADSLKDIYDINSEIKKKLHRIERSKDVS